MKETKKFISPNAWFSFEYPSHWYEFEDGEGSFLFYNPNAWDGNFRISGLKGKNTNFGIESVKQELQNNKEAQPVSFLNGKAAYSKTYFQQEDYEFTSHSWTYGIADMSLNCTYTTFKNESFEVAEHIIDTLEVRDSNKKYPSEIIPIRLSEIYEINSAYDSIVSLVKKELTVDFQSIEEDIHKLDQLKDADIIGQKKRDSWLAMGLTLGVVLANEVEGLEWRTLIDGNREDAILFYLPTQKVIDPMKLVWSKIKSSDQFTIKESYKEALAMLHA